MERINLINFYPPQRLDRYPTPLTLGVARLGAYLAHKHHQVRIISMPLDGSTATDDVLAGDPSIIGMTANFWDAKQVLQTVEDVRGSGFAGDVLIGGPEAGVMYAAQKPMVTRTFLVPHDGEVAMDRYFQERFRLSEYALQAALAMPPQVDRREILPVGLQLFSESFQSLLASDLQRGADFTWFDTVHGCPFNCGYCDHGRNRRMVASYPEDHIEGEVHIIGKKFKDVFIIDPILGGGNPRNAVRRLEQFQAFAPNTKLEYYLRPEMITNEVVEAARRTRTSNIFVGLQTLNADVPSWLRRNNPASLPRIAELCHNAPVTVELIVGLPGDTMSGLKETLRRVAEEIRPKNIAAYPLSVLDGTELSRHLVARGETIWIERDPSTHRAIASSTYDKDGLHGMVVYASDFVQEYNKGH